MAGSKYSVRMAVAPEQTTVCSNPAGTHTARPQGTTHTPEPVRTVSTPDEA